MKSSKSDGGRNSQMNGAAAPVETGPLFPRLHISETEKAGPRAPPRNKMALFEQFTVPSHRFVQPRSSRATTVFSNQQQQQFDYRPPYLAYYMPSSVPSSNVVSARPQPSLGVSSCITSSISEQEPQRATSSQTCENYGLLRASTKEEGSINLSSLLEEKAKVVSDDFSTQSSPRAHQKTQGMLYTSPIFESICDKFASASAEAAMVPINTYIKDDMSIVEACPVAEDQGCDHDMVEQNKSIEVSEAMQINTVNPRSIADVGSEHRLCSSSFALDQPCQQPDVDHERVLREDCLQVNDLTKDGSNTDLKTNGGCKEDQTSLPRGNCLVASAQTTSTNEDARRVYFRDANASADVLLREKGESMGDSQNNQVGSNEVSELSQQGAAGRGNDESLSSVLTQQAIRPKDVIRAVGQQQFWKARKALLRQQRIFSDQVFQLHKLIKVQQLLAETPGTLIDEEIPFGSVDQYAGTPSQCNTLEREDRCNGKTHMTTSLKDPRSKEQVNKTRKQPESMLNPQWYAAGRNDGLGSSPYLPAFTPGGVSTWGYPSLGMGQWMGQMPMQGRPSAYQPFAAPFPTGAPYGGLYGPGSLGPVSQMMPFCIPYAGQRSEPWEETSSNIGPHVADNYDPQVAPAFGHGAHDPAGAWQFVPYQNPYFNQRIYASVSEKNVSIGSGASINHQRPVKPLHASGMEHTSGEGRPNNNGLENERANNNGLDKSINQSETSSHGNTSGFKFLSSACMRTMPAPRKAGSYQQNSDPPAQNTNTSSVFHNSRSAKQHAANGRGREEASKVELRWPKRQQSDQMLFSNGSSGETMGPLSDPGGNALHLFPLVPSLGTDGAHSNFKQNKEDRQGRVIKAVPHPAVAASQSAAGILLSLQRERRQ